MYDNNPFGNTDGAQADPKDLVENFIDIVPPSAAVGSIGENFTSMRFIVGSKGSGKTHYLCVLRERIKEKNKSNPHSTFITEIENACSGTDFIIRFSGYYNFHFLNEKWTTVWTSAIYASVISALIHNNDLKTKLSDEDKVFFEESIKKLGLTCDCQMGIYDYFRQILYCFDSKNKFDSFINNNLWNMIRNRFYSVLRDLPPMYFFLDSIDEEYENAPVYWLRCQVGLFLAVYHMLSKEVIREKLHVVVCIRDQVYAAVRNSEHQTKISHESHILRLHWNKKSLKFFIERKIEKLKPCYFLKQPHRRTVSEWLGSDLIHNCVRDCDENLIDYIIRHTRLIPRDIINICNSLSKIKVLLSEDPSINVDEEIRKRISICAREIGDELLIICSKQIVIDEMPANSHLYSSAYTSVDEYRKGNFEVLRDVLSKIDSDSMTITDLKRIEDKVDSIFQKQTNILDILWFNGVIGYVINDQVTFYMNHNSINTHLDHKYDEYVFRSCIIDSLNLDLKGLRKKVVE